MNGDQKAPQIEFRSVTKHYGPIVAVEDFSLAVPRGEFLTILGPSGSGKTTTLMLLAGFEAPTSGDVFISGHRVTAVPSYHRDQGIVFQSYALFPHLTVSRNLEFPLEMRGIKAAERASRVHRILDRVHLSGFGDRLPSQLSGGQQQRVALARALIADPPVLLLDEPLGALDRNLREQMQGELKALHKEFEITTVCVTHDQEEALTLSDRIVVMRGGKIIQVDTPETLYDRPTSRFVANFFGEANILDRVDFSGLGGASDALPMLRPECISIQPAASAGAAQDDVQSVAGVIEEMIYAGAQRRYRARAGRTVLFVREPSSVQRPVFQPGDPVRLEWPRSAVRYVTP